MHIFSVLFTAQSVVKFNDDEELKKAAVWARDSGLTKVYVESFRKDFVEQSVLEKARDYFQDQGFEVDGCVTTVGFPRNAWRPGQKQGDHEVPCYSYLPNWELMETIFRRTAAVFNTIMIDDFLFTYCECDECKTAAGGRSLEDYHADVMHEMSVERILKPAKEVNPGCKIIIKYPNWYDSFHARGYDVIRQTGVFDYIWAGNETREPDNARWGRYAQTQAFYLQDWDQKISDEKCMGGWYDWIETKPETYLEQARNTILGGARESMLFCYHGLTDNDLGISDNKAFRAEREGLHRLAYLISGKKRLGITAPKKMDSDPPVEKFIYGYLGMLGLPVIADIKLDKDAPAMILGPQAAAFPNVRGFALDFAGAGKPLVLTRGFTDLTGLKLPDSPVLDSGVCGTRIYGDHWNLMDTPDLEALRRYLLKPFGITFTAPSRVALNLYDDDMEVIQNFNNEAVRVTLDLAGRNQKARTIRLILSKEKQVEMVRRGSVYELSIPARTLVLLY
ncbi:MAG: hypothetical protein LBB77_07660 [Treponema sp.]|jgi:hypothetical protein|nr:hypothetical protein [Treponema sp.]